MLVYKTFFLKFLLLPLIALALMGVMVFVQKKNALANNKRLIIYILLASIVLALPGIAGLAGNAFSPYWYLFAQFIYTGLGILHVNLLALYFKNDHAQKTWAVVFELLLTLICMVVGAYLFTIIFNWLSPYEGYAWMSATSIFIFPVPLLFYYTWLKFTAIPFDIYKVWTYNPALEAVDFNGMDFDKLMVLNLEFTKKLDNGNRFTVKAKSPAEISLGNWFFRFIEDYNIKYPNEPIEIMNTMGEPYAWIFYSKRSFFHRRQYYDFEKTIAENKITERLHIICKRVIEGEEEKVIVANKNMFSNS